MCSECLSYPCRSRCPNAPEAKSIGECAHCGEPIFIGEQYAQIGYEDYHKDCLDELSTADWLQLLGADIKEAEAYEPEYEREDIL